MHNEVLVLYRHIFKLAIRYPSRNRVMLLCGIHDAFKDSKGLSAGAELEERLKMAHMGLAHLQFYAKKMKEVKEASGPISVGDAAPTSMDKGEKTVFF